MRYLIVFCIQIQDLSIFMGLERGDAWGNAQYGFLGNKGCFNQFWRAVGSGERRFLICAAAADNLCGGKEYDKD